MGYLLQYSGTHTHKEPSEDIFRIMNLKYLLTKALLIMYIQYLYSAYYIYIHPGMLAKDRPCHQDFLSRDWLRLGGFWFLSFLGNFVCLQCSFGVWSDGVQHILQYDINAASLAYHLRRLKIFSATGAMCTQTQYHCNSTSGFHRASPQMI